ncbi:unnamed protein product [Allacma fusca]|uniref:Chitin-binding type-4 domain-containing protein n=1 Tax=Allacma fusca TaxID=39272 RepID=A0A8J2NMR8_9HEXA|nr:unnamed protein product [Allacma fusca]
MNKFVLGAVLLMVSLAGDRLVDGHGMLWDPAGRQSLWRFEEFKKYDPEPNFTDNQLFCGGFQHQWETQGGKCGICGDPFNEPSPRAHEGGGLYGKGIIAKTYKSGSKVNITINLTAAHLGYFELKLCPHNNPLVPATQECLDQYPLQLVDGSGSRFVPPNRAAHYVLHVQLPQGVTCQQCVLQWHYNTGNSWGTDPDGSSGMGRGAQEVFRSCADIQIV